MVNHKPGKCEPGYKQAFIICLSIGFSYNEMVKLNFSAIIGLEEEVVRRLCLEKYFLYYSRWGLFCYALKSL